MHFYLRPPEDREKYCAYHWCPHPDSSLLDEPLAVPISVLIFTVLMHHDCYKHWVLMGQCQEVAHLN